MKTPTDRQELVAPFPVEVSEETLTYGFIALLRWKFGAVPIRTQVMMTCDGIRIDIPDPDMEMFRYSTDEIRRAFAPGCQVVEGTAGDIHARVPWGRLFRDLFTYQCWLGCCYIRHILPHARVGIWDRGKTYIAVPKEYQQALKIPQGRIPHVGRLDIALPPEHVLQMMTSSHHEKI